MLVSLRLVLLVGGVLLAGITVWTTIRFIQDTGKTEAKLENLRDQLEVREQIDEAITTAPSDVDAATELLQQRQNP